MTRLTTTLAAAALAAALTLVLCSGAQAASYYNIVNTQSGKALETTPSGKVRIAPLNRTSLAQQFKRINTLWLGSWFESSIQNRLGSCLRSDLIPSGALLTNLKLGTCAGATGSSGGDMSKRWSHLAGNVTGTPNVPGYQLVNSQSAGYVTDFNLCFSTTCPQAYDATVFDASFIASDPAEFGGAAKWSYRFAVSATP